MSEKCIQVFASFYLFRYCGFDLFGIILSDSEPTEPYFLAILAFKFIDPPRNVFQVSNLKRKSSWKNLILPIVLTIEFSLMKTRPKLAVDAFWPNSLPLYFRELDICSFNFMLFPFPILQHFNLQISPHSNGSKSSYTCWKDDSILL